MRPTLHTTTELVQGRYRLDRLLGRGGMADVYLAHDEQDGGAVAVKILRSGDPRLARRLAQEARALERLDHPNLVRLLGCEVADGEAHLVMELVDGPTLAQRLLDGPLDPADAARLGTEVASALSYVHEQGIVHRDVKPANILVPDGGGARLADFGIARLVDASTLTLEQTTVGTAAYMAPEQLEDHQVGPPADVWSLGLVLLECLTGHRVYEGTPAEIIARRLATPVPPLDELAPAWRPVVGAMLERRPDRRIPARQVGPMLRTPMVTAASVDAAGGEPYEPTGPIDVPALGRAAAVGAGVAGVGSVAGAGAAGAGEPWAEEEPRAPFAMRRTSVWLVLLAVGVGLVAAILALTHLGGGPASTVQGPPAPATTVHKASKPAALTPAVALQQLEQAVGAGLRAHSIDQPDGQAIMVAAARAVTDAASGHTPLAAVDLQTAASALALGRESGRISLDTALTLQSDLQRVADTIGLPGAAVPTTTTTTTTTTLPPTPPPPPHPPHHHHHGDGGGDGGGG